MNYNNNDIFNSVLNPCIIDAYINKQIISHEYFSLILGVVHFKIKPIMDFIVI